MKLSKISLGLPLLSKELTEQAARRRTYEIRIAYAVVLFLIAYYCSAEILRLRSINQFSILGRGGKLFESLIWIQFGGIYLFMPAICCGVLTTEKERGTLGLLFLTRLGPWTILLEKLLGRVVPMLSFLLLSLPLLVFCYSLGGLSFISIWLGFWLLFITVVQVGVISLFCSAFFRTTIASYLASYLIGFTIYFLPVFTFISFRSLFNESLIVEYYEILLLFLHDLFGIPVNTQSILFDSPEPALLMFLGPAIFFGFYQSGSFYLTFLCSLPILFSCLFFFCLARVFLVRHAFVESRNLLLAIFRRLDHGFVYLNNRLTRGIVLGRDSTKLPQDKPIEWLETHKRSLGTARYLARVFVILEVPVVLICCSAAYIGDAKGVSVVLFALWIIATLFISVKSSSLIAGERTHGTLDVLLATPMTGQEIILQKSRGIRRLMYVLAIPFLTIFIFEAWLFVGLHSNSGVQSATFFYLLASVTCLLIYFPLVSWVSLYIGMHARTQTRAMFGALAALVVWFVVPITIASFVFQNAHMRVVDIIVIFLSPAAFPVFLEIENSQFIAVMFILNTLIYAGVLLIFRMACLLRADILLKRTGSI